MMARRDGLCRQVAELHAVCIDHGFLTQLGRDFLELMYRAIDEDSSSHLLVSVRDGELIGFVSGGNGLGRIYRRLLKRPFALAWALRWSLVNPRHWRGIAENLRYGRRMELLDGRLLPAAELLFLAVDARYRGTGVAEDLYRQLSTRFRDMGMDAFRVVVGSELARAHHFYLKMGGVPCGEVNIHGDSVATVYVQRVESH